MIPESYDDKYPSANPVPFRNLLSMITEGVAVLARGRIIYANTALCEMAGKNRSEIVGCRFLDLVPESERVPVSEYLRHIDVASSGAVDFRLERHQSAGRWVRLHAASIDLRGVYAKAPGICCSLHDITDFQDHIIELQRDNRRVRSHLDATESVLISFSPYDCNDILMVNRYVEALLGCSIKELMNGSMHLFDFVHPDFLSQVMEFYNGFPDTYENAEMEYMIVRNDRQVRWVRDMGSTLFVERGRGMPRSIDHTLIDITELKNRELELEEERRKLASIIKNSSDMIYRVDKAGNFLDLNPAGKKLLGVKGDFRNLNIRDLYVDPQQRERLRKKVEEKGNAQQLVKWKVTDGQEIDVVINAVAETSAHANAPTFQGIAHNVTRTLELQKVDTIKKITGGLSDKINTPLMTLSFNMQMAREAIRDGSADKEQILQYLDEMEEAYTKIVGPMMVVRDKHWELREVPDGSGGTIYEIREKK